MVRPSHDEIIRDLTREVATLNERLNTVREEVKEIKRNAEEARRLRWALLPPVIGAVVNVLLAALVAYLVAKK